MARILCLGGVGYIGSHCALKLFEDGFKVIIADNLINAHIQTVKTLLFMSEGKIRFRCVDLRDMNSLKKLFTLEQFDAVIHFAGSKSVKESIFHPLKYYENNVMGSLNLLLAMKNSNCKKLVFSSSATVYKFKTTLLTEDDELKPCNPYGHSKLFVEQILQDLSCTDHSWRISLLRYFNPIGAHPSGLIGENSENAENLVPCLLNVLSKKGESVPIYGTDWDTADGSGVRDYIHILDLAEGHSAALDLLLKNSDGFCRAYNLGTGTGVSVLDMIRYFSKAAQKNVPYSIASRRPGDLASVIADPSRARRELNWRASRSIE